VTLAFVMLLGRFMMAIPVLALAGSLAGKRVAPPSAGTFPTNGAIFVVLLIGVILIVAALTFFPADALGPIVEHLADDAGQALLGEEWISMTERKAAALWDGRIVKGALVDSLRKFDPRIQARNPVMFVVEVTALAGDGDSLAATSCWTQRRSRRSSFKSPCGCGSPCCSPTSPRRWPRAAARPRPTTCARRAPKPRPSWSAPAARSNWSRRPSSRGDVVMVEAGDVIPGDGEVIEGIAAVNEAAITGESAPVIRESGGDRSAVTGGTTVISDWIKVGSPPTPARPSSTA
jgi:hypothetical protein